MGNQNLREIIPKAGFSESDGELVWLLYDDCYCEDCVENAINFWLPDMVPGGMVAFHNCDDAYRFSEKTLTDHGNSRASHGVYRAVMRSKILREEFSLTYKNPALNWRRGKLFGGMRVYRKRDDET